MVLPPCSDPNDAYASYAEHGPNGRCSRCNIARCQPSHYYSSGSSSCQDCRSPDHDFDDKTRSKRRIPARSWRRDQLRCRRTEQWCNRLWHSDRRSFVRRTRTDWRNQRHPNQQILMKSIQHEIYYRLITPSSGTGQVGSLRPLVQSRLIAPSSHSEQIAGHRTLVLISTNSSIIAAESRSASIASRESQS